MSGTTNSPTACFINTTGIHSPAFNDILTYLQSQIQSIFGSDIVLSNDSQDGQMLGIFATAIYDNNSLAIAVYNSYSPSTAQGVGLSSVVKINGIARRLPTNSTVDLVIGGQAGTTITNGVVQDQNNNNWVLTNIIVIPPSGQITATAISQLAGAITASANSITKIAIPILGWQTVNNPQAAVEGAPLESDAALRARQTISTMLPSVTALDGMIGSVASVTGVTAFQAYENDTSATDSNGIPSHSVSIVVIGGTDLAIASAIAAHKTPGAGTYGTTTVSIRDAYGVPHNINFFRPTVVPISVVIHLTALNGYSSATGNAIINAVIAYITAIPIGSNVFLTKVITVANLSGADTLTFNLTSILMATNNGTPTAQDLGILFNQKATATVSTVTLAIP